jgi:prepilin peptidase CpaA
VPAFASPWHMFLASAVLISAIAAVIDYRTGEIPNWLTLYPLGIGLAANALVGFRSGGPSGAGSALLASFLGAALCAIVPVLLFRKGAIGGGDVKLLVAIGALCKTQVGIEAELYSFLAAALYGPAKMAYEGKLLRVMGNTIAIVANPLLPKEKRRTLDPEMMTSVRFGPAIFVGMVAAALANTGFL